MGGRGRCYLEKVQVKDYRPLLSDIATLLEDVVDYMERDLQDDQLQTDFTHAEVQKLLDGLNEMFGELDEEYDGKRF